MTDGNITTRWSADGVSNNNQWIEVSFGTSTNVNRVVLKEYGGGTQSFQINTYALQYWNGTSYFPTVSTTKIRLYVTKANYIPSINEIEAYNISCNTGNIIDQDVSAAAMTTYTVQPELFICSFSS